MKTNVRAQYSGTYTYEGAKAVRTTPEQELSRAVMSCMLWEDSFYESGESIADRITNLVAKVSADKCNTLAQYARNEMKLRHAPLWIAVAMANLPEHKKYVASLLAEIIQRPAELTEALSLYWKGGKCPVSAQFKKGLAKAFTKFSAYQLAKYDRQDAIKLRDVLFICHAKPKDEEQTQVWKQLIAGTLASPDTWEVELSASTNKLESWTRLLSEKKLGALALIRNLRNMEQAKVDRALVKSALLSADASKLMPHQLIASASHAPSFEPEIEKLFLQLSLPKLDGETALLIDISGSMNDKLSAKSEMIRFDAACGLAMVAREMFDDLRIFSFSSAVVECAPRRGFALRDSIKASQPMGGTQLGAAVEAVAKRIKTLKRLIVITDEQSSDSVVAVFGSKNYMINVASYQHAVGYGNWIRIDGFSENCLKFLRQSEL